MVSQLPGYELVRKWLYNLFGLVTFDSSTAIV